MQEHLPYPLAVRVNASDMPATRASVERPVTLRICGPADQQALCRLAGLDSARPLEGTILAAEIADELLAAICVETGRVVADPFSHTAGLVELLRSRAAQLERGKNRRLARPGRRLRRTRAWLAGPPREPAST